MKLFHKFKGKIANKPIYKSLNTKNKKSINKLNTKKYKK